MDNDRASRDFIVSAMLGNFQIIVDASLRRLKFVSTLGNPFDRFGSIGLHPEGIQASIRRDSLAELANSPNSPQTA